jgi:hypothetical protein
MEIEMTKAMKIGMQTWMVWEMENVAEAKA